MTIVFPRWQVRLGKVLVLPFAAFFTVLALGFFASSLGILLGPVAGAETEFDWPVFVRLVLAGILFLPGLVFTGIAGALWLFIFGRSAAYNR